MVSGASSTCGTAVGIAVAPVSVAVALISPGVPRTKDVGVSEGVGVSVAVAVGLGVNVAVGFGDGNGIGVEVDVGVGGTAVGGSAVNVAVGGTEVGTGDEAETERVGASVGNVKTDMGFPLAAMIPSSPPIATTISTGAIHFSRAIRGSSSKSRCPPILILSRI
jgi:hypothetical protein